MEKLHYGKVNYSQEAGTLTEKAVDVHSSPGLLFENDCWNQLLENSVQSAQRMGNVYSIQFDLSKLNSQRLAQEAFLGVENATGLEAKFTVKEQGRRREPCVVGIVKTVTYEEGGEEKQLVTEYEIMNRDELKSRDAINRWIDETAKSAGIDVPAV